ncbi:Cytochrome P450 4d2 [Eumeta japonica]|uniref:Cytochrome P450 4d2 n=1 Tax=Eumeta variegata TaxID=151549 RepID=A0A4C1UCS2_EUMVA|nr:Cytochrome P450 4d2 [Eumeta japonica]
MCVSVNAQKDSESEYVKAVTDISEVISKRIRHPLLRTDAFFKLSSAKMRHDQALSVLHRFTEQVVKDRRDALDAAETTLSNYDSEIGIKKKSAFLDLLLLSEIDGQKLDNKSVREEVDTFMFEGHDTTTSGICFTLYCLSKHSDVQEKVLQEQYELFGDDRHRHPTYNELGSMRYLEMVIRESLRLYPSVPLITRILTEDTKIAGTYVPKDTNLLISIFHMQRHPSIYEDPLVFKPERFDPAQRNHQNAYNWVAFSAGPRNCIGI